MFNNSKTTASSRRNRRKRQGTFLRSKWIETIAIQRVISRFSFFLLVWCASGVAPTFAQTITHVPLFTVEGEVTAISGAGDVNGDGFADLIVGAVGDDNNDSGSGSARVFSGVDGSILNTFDGVSDGSLFGFSVSGAGDVNGDGFADLIVGAFRDDANGIESGSARVFSGVDGSVLYDFDGDSVGDHLGQSVSGAGDVNGDGFADLIVGAPLDDNNDVASSGSARVYSGIDGSVLYTFNGDSVGDGFGWSVSGAGDVNGDGFADLIVGSPEEDNNGSGSGSARVFSGVDGSVLYTFDGNRINDGLGTSVGSAGDVNGDGFADLIAGATGVSTFGISGGNVGLARVYSGSDGSVIYDFFGSGSFDSFGEQVSGVGDVNGDGVADFLASSRSGDGEGGDGDGYARLFVSQITGPVVLGDCNLDGAVNFLDIAPFINRLSTQTFQAEADIDGSGVVDFLDIAPFIALLSGQ